MKKSKFLRNTTFNFCLVLLIVSLMIFIINKRIVLSLDSTILDEQKLIIEILASFFISEVPPYFSQGFFIIYISWTIAVLIESLLLYDSLKSKETYRLIRLISVPVQYD